MDDEQNAAGVGAPVQRPAVNPTIPGRDRSPLPGPGLAERLAATRSAAVTSTEIAALVALVGAMPWAVGVLIFQGPAEWQSALLRWALLLAATVAAATAVAFEASLVRFGQFSNRHARATVASDPARWYLTAGDLDTRASALLLRAQKAIDAVTSSEVCQAGLLDAAAHGTALAAQEREIASALREQSKLRQARAGLPAIASDSAAGELLDRQREAAQVADQSIADRVAALEQLAAEVRSADSAYRDWQAHAAVSELAGRHLDVLARTAADVHAIAEINAMSQRARAVCLSLRDRPGL